MQLYSPYINSSKKYMKKRETERNNQKTNISKNSIQTTQEIHTGTLVARRSQKRHHLYIVIDLKKLIRICLIIFDAELPLGELYAVQRFLNCLSASCPKRLQILFSNALYFCKKFSSFNINLVTGRQKI